MSNTYVEPVSKPDNARARGRHALIFPGPQRSIRDAPTTERTRQVGSVYNGELMTVFDPGIKDGQNRTWNWMEGGRGNGWVWTDGMSFLPSPAGLDTKPVTKPDKAATQEAVKPDVELTRKILLMTLAEQLNSLSVTVARLAALEG